MKTWTKTPPTEMGWYWARYEKEDDPEIVEVTSYRDGSLLIWRTQIDDWLEPSDFYRWYPEPIQCPELKDEEQK
jgi:hypothetical protein